MCLSGSVSVMSSKSLQVNVTLLSTNLVIPRLHLKPSPEVQYNHCGALLRPMSSLFLPGLCFFLQTPSSVLQEQQVFPWRNWSLTVATSSQCVSRLSSVTTSPENNLPLQPFPSHPSCSIRTEHILNYAPHGTSSLFN